jgi:hypothetical protein
MNAKNVLKRLQEAEQKLGASQEDEKEKARTEYVSALLRRYEELMVEFRKLPIEEQQRQDKEEVEHLQQWYHEWQAAEEEWERTAGKTRNGDWQAFREWGEAWSLEWEKTHVKSHDNALILAKTGGD